MGRSSAPRMHRTQEKKKEGFPNGRGKGIVFADLGRGSKEGKAGPLYSIREKRKEGGDGRDRLPID